MARPLVLLLALLALTTAACGGDEATTTAAAREGETAAVREVRTGVAGLLDVRTEKEHDAGHAEGALHIALADIEKGERPDVAKDARLYVYCRTGRRAAEAVALLRRDGWTDVVNVGGLDDWDRMGGERAAG